MVARAKNRSSRTSGRSTSHKRIALITLTAILVGGCALAASSYAADTAITRLLGVTTAHTHKNAAVPPFSGTGAITISTTVTHEDQTVLTAEDRDREFTFEFVLDGDGSFVPLDTSRAYPIELFEGTGASRTSLGSSTIRSGETFTLRHDRSAVISQVPRGALYQISEQSRGSYSVTSTGTQGHLVGATATATFTLANRALEYGPLAIIKSVEGDQSDPGQRFTFALSFDANQIPEFKPSTLTYVRRINVADTVLPLDGTGIVENAAVTFALPATYTVQFDIGDGEAVIFDNLPVGLRYRLEETAVPGYSTSVSEVAGVIQNPAGIEIPIVNHKGSVSNEKWSLDLTSRLVDISRAKSADADHEFTFHITVATPGLEIGYQTGSIAYEIDHTDGTTTTDVINKKTGEETATISVGDTFRLLGTSVDNVTYTLTQVFEESDPYIGAFTFLKGTVRSGQHLELDWKIIFGGQDDTRPAQLLVSKRVDGQALCPVYPFVYRLEVDGQMPRTFTLMDDESLSFDVTRGARYRVTELVTTTDGYALVGASNAQGTVGGEVLTDGIVFTNRYLAPLTTTVEAQISFDLRGSSSTIPASIKASLIDTRTNKTVATASTSATDEWLVRFEDVLATDETGARIPYTVRTTPPANFTAKSSRITDALFAVTWSYIPPVTVNTPYVSKSISPATAPTKNFTFALKSLKDAPLPPDSGGGQSTVTIASGGMANFGTIAFSQAGRYEYRVSELAGSDTNYSQDKTIYALVYDIELKDTPTGMQLIPTVTLTRLDTGKKVTSIGSQSTYSPGLATPTSTPPQPQGAPAPVGPATSPVKTGDNAALSFWLFWLIGATDLTLCLACRRRFLKSKETRA